MIRRPPRSTLDRSSAASDVYKRQGSIGSYFDYQDDISTAQYAQNPQVGDLYTLNTIDPVSYTHLRAHETVLDLVCRLLLEKKKNKLYNILL